MWFWRTPKILFSCGILTVVPGLVELPALYLEVPYDGIRVCAASVRLFTLWELWVLFHCCFPQVIWLHCLNLYECLLCEVFTLWGVQNHLWFDFAVCQPNLRLPCLLHLCKQSLWAWDASLPLLWRLRKATWFNHGLHVSPVIWNKVCLNVLGSFCFPNSATL